jgi:type II secretory pathway predicted ATPase ExeA
MELESVRLGQEAFGRNSDPRFCFEFTSFGRAYGRLLSLLKEGRGFVLVIGGPGAGKTTLVRKAAEALASEQRSVLWWPAEHAAGSSAEALPELLDRATATARDGQPPPIVIVDAADELPDEVIDDACSRPMGGPNRPAPIQLVLICSPELAKRLSRREAAMGGAIAERVQLLRMNDEDVAPYVNTRLALAGAAEREVFPPSAMRLITLYGKGNPGRINALCRQALLLAQRDGRVQVPVRCLHEAAASPIFGDAVGFGVPLPSGEEDLAAESETELGDGEADLDDSSANWTVLREGGNARAASDVAQTIFAGEPADDADAGGRAVRRAANGRRRLLWVGGLAASAAIGAILAGGGILGEPTGRAPSESPPSSPSSAAESGSGGLTAPEMISAATAPPAVAVVDASAVAERQGAAAAADREPPTTRVTADDGADDVGGEARIADVAVASASSARVADAPAAPAATAIAVPPEPAGESPPEIASEPPLATERAPLEATEPESPVAIETAPPPLAAAPAAIETEPVIEPAIEIAEQASERSRPDQGPAPPAAPPALPPAPALTSAPATIPQGPAKAATTDAGMLIERGDAFLAEGDYASARRFYEFAARMGSAAGALALARTYDPRLLTESPMTGIRPDTAKAIAWYRVARDWGAAEAALPLRALAGDAENSQPGKLPAD